MPSQPLSKIPSASDFAERFRQIGDDLKSLACELALALDSRPELREELYDKGITRGFIDRLEGLGRGQIHESLTFSTTPGAMRIIGTPLSEQTLAITNGVDVLDDDETTTRRIPLHEMTGKQAKLAIARSRIRSISEQRTAIREKKAKLLPVKPDKDFRVSKDGVTTTRPGTWSRALILQWLSEMG